MSKNIHEKVNTVITSSPKPTPTALGFRLLLEVCRIKKPEMDV